MAVEVVMPRMGLTMEEGTVVAWLKQENQPVEAGEPLLEIETDKSTVEIESPARGILGKILILAGATVPVGSLIGYIVAEGETLPELAAQPGSGPAAPASTPAAQTGAPPAGVQPEDGKTKASPAARTLARQLGVELSQVQGSGPGGRVVAWNVQEFSKLKTPPVEVKASPLAQRLAADLEVDLSAVQGSGPGGRIIRLDVERAVKPESPPHPAQPPRPGIQPLTRSQRLMAERMASSFRTAPHFYLHVEVDARRLVALRLNLKERLQARYGVSLTFTDLLVKYSALTLRQHPGILAHWTEEGLASTGQVNIGIAMDTPAGLIVPVIREADRLGLAEIARQRADLSERARAGKLLPQDLELGAFTITNLGMFGIDSFDAILNPPQAAILAVGRIKERALVSEGQVVAASMMNLSLSVDHRVLDGASAARFLGDLGELIEQPDLALA